MENFQPNLEANIDVYKILKLTKDNAGELQKLLEQSNDYYKLAFQRDVESNDAQELLTMLPEGKTSENKFNYGIYDSNELIGVIDLIKDYPEEKTWFLGLLLINPHQRGNGLGAKVFNSLQSNLKNTDAKKIKLSVVEQNIKALDFWKKLNFKEIEKKVEGKNTMIYFQRDLY